MDTNGLSRARRHDRWMTGGRREWKCFEAVLAKKQSEERTAVAWGDPHVKADVRRGQGGWEICSWSVATGGTV